MSKLVIIESPYASNNNNAGNIEQNIEYAKAAIIDSLHRQEAPFASHLFYTQPGILNDDEPDERLAGIMAGYAWGLQADLIAIYGDLGVSNGMHEAIKFYSRNMKPIEYRTLKEWRNRF